MARSKAVAVALLLACTILSAMTAVAAQAGKDNSAKTPNPPKPPKAPKPPKPIKPVTEKCTIKSYKYCYNVPIKCPSRCPRNCYINCLTCAPVCLCNVPGAICQDPRFIGADGITFYFHGKKDRDFCLVSDSDLHINAHFIGKRGPTMSRDFTWIQSIGLLFGDHKLYLGAMKTTTWNDDVARLAITFDGESVLLPSEEGASWRSTAEPKLSITRTRGANGVTVEVEGQFKVTTNVVPITAEESRVHRYGLTDDDCFAHLELGFKFYSLTNDVHGVLGQTYRDDYVSRVKVSSNMPIMSGEPKYETSTLFSTDCEVARFGRGSGARIAVVAEQPNMTCASRMGGRGIACER